MRFISIFTHEPTDRPPEAFFKAYPRLVPERLAGQRDIREGMEGIPFARGVIPGFYLLAKDAIEQGDSLVEREAGPHADVDDFARCRRGGASLEGGVHDVVNVGEIARLYLR